MDLTIVEAKDRFQVEDKANKILKSSQIPDYLVFIYQAENSANILRLGERTGVKSFLINSDVIPEERKIVGYPRKKFSSWIGHMFPDEYEAGQMLAERLICEAEKQAFPTKDGQHHMIGLGGGRDTTVSCAREAGLKKAIGKCSNWTLDRFILTHWDMHIAQEKTEALLDLYPDASIYWAASDGIGLGAIEAMRNDGRTLGKDAFVGGVDWTVEGTHAIAQGDMVASVGGHFMEGGWALVMLYDHFNGKDFRSTGMTINSEMRLMDKDNHDKYMKVIDRQNWLKVDFKQFTRTHNPKLTRYDFSPDALVSALDGAVKRN